MIWASSQLRSSSPHAASTFTSDGDVSAGTPRIVGRALDQLMPRVDASIRQ